MSPLLPRLENLILLLISVAWIGLQIKGYYWIFVALLLFSVFSLRDFLPSFFVCTRNVVLSVFLLIFSLSLLAAALFDGGLRALVSEIPVSLPLLPLFIFSCITSRNGEICVYSKSKYWLYAFGVGSLTVLSALWKGFQFADLPASSLRPLEFQASSGVFLLTAMSNAASFTLSTRRHKRYLPVHISIVSLVLSLIAFICFQGATSALGFLLNLVSVFILYAIPSIRRFSSFLFGALAFCFVFALTLVLDFRFLFLKFLVVPIFSNDIANGRASLLRAWITDFGQESPPYIGSQSSVPADFFTHNIVLDSLIKDGSIAASSLLLFGLVVFLCLFRDLLDRFDGCRLLNFLQFCLMTIPALLQPVQFAHAFAFLLSIATLGILISSSKVEPVDLDSHPLRN